MTFPQLCYNVRLQEGIHYKATKIGCSHQNCFAWDVFLHGERRVSPHFPTIVVATNKKIIPLLPFRVPNLSVVSMRQEIPNWLDHRPNLRPTSARLLSTSPAHKTVSMRRLKPSTRPTPMSGGIPKPARGPRHRGFIAVIQHPKGSGSPETNKWGLEV